jgi:pimeloyl-ACP methyl ester carboxylesterase
MERLETRYAKSGKVNIAYQVVGDGPFDLIWVPGWISNVEESWEVPEYAHFLRRLASFSRLILFDKRGTGLSDRVSNDRLPTLEERMDDVRAVLEASGSAHAAVFGASEGGNMSILFTATYPERVRALVLAGVYAKRVWSPDYPWAPTPERREREYGVLERDWAGKMDLADLAPSAVDDPLLMRRIATFFRRSASPGAAVALLRMNTAIDTRPVLPTIRVPTLVLQRSGDRDVNIEEGRWIARQIQGARYVELLRMATGAGASCSRTITGSCDGSWNDFTGASWTQLAMASSRASTVRRELHAAPTRYAALCHRSGLSYAPGFTLASARLSATSLRASPSTSGRASHRLQSRARCLSRAP